FERGVEAVDRTLQDGYERVSAESPRSQLAENHGRTDGTVFLCRGFGTPGRLRSPQSQRLAAPSRLTGLASAAERRINHLNSSVPGCAEERDPRPPSGR